MNNKILLQQQFAAAYGEGSFSCQNYNDGCNATTNPGTTDPGTTTTTGGGIFAPDTGLFAQPAYVLYPTLLAVAVVIGTLSYLIVRQVKKLRQK